MRPCLRFCLCRMLTVCFLSRQRWTDRQRGAEKISFNDEDDHGGPLRVRRDTVPEASDMMLRTTSKDSAASSSSRSRSFTILESSNSHSGISDTGMPRSQSVHDATTDDDRQSETEDEDEYFAKMAPGNPPATNALVSLSAPPRSAALDFQPSSTLVLVPPTSEFRSSSKATPVKKKSVSSLSQQSGHTSVPKPSRIPQGATGHGHTTRHKRSRPNDVGVKNGY